MNKMKGLVKEIFHLEKELSSGLTYQEQLGKAAKK